MRVQFDCLHAVHRYELCSCKVTPRESYGLRVERLLASNEEHPDPLHTDAYRPISKVISILVSSYPFLTMLVGKHWEPVPWNCSLHIGLQPSRHTSRAGPACVVEVCQVEADMLLSERVEQGLVLSADGRLSWRHAQASIPW